MQLNHVVNEQRVLMLLLIVFYVSGVEAEVDCDRLHENVLIKQQAVEVVFRSVRLQLTAA